MNKRINTLDSVEVEHLVGDRHGPLVLLRTRSNLSVIIGQMTPDQAREIAAHLFEAAARAEYETDLLSEMKKNGWKDDMILGVFAMVRAGELLRHTEIG